MKKIMVIALCLAAAAFFPAACNTHSGEPAPFPTPVQTPTPGTDGYWSASSAGITLKWKVSGANLDCKLSADTTGWVAVGFNSQGKMDGANIILGYVNGGGAVIADMHGAGHSHPADITDNVTNRAGTDNGTTTEIIFTIPLANDANNEDFALAQDGIYWLIMTRGANGDDSLGLSAMPAGRGIMQVQLF